jgi:hypothetical protein
MSHKKCQFCGTSEICLFCKQEINCRKTRDCYFCGDLYGRPKITNGFRHLSASVLILDLTTSEPFLYLMIDKGEIAEPGGKFDSSKDKNLEMTAMRETKEELNLHVVITSEDPYVDVCNGVNRHRCYILINSQSNRIISPMFKLNEYLLKAPLGLIKHYEFDSNARLYKILNLKFKKTNVASYLNNVAKNHN